MIDKIYIWYNNLNVNVRVIIGGFSVMFFGYIMVNLFDLIINKKADW